MSKGNASAEYLREAREERGLSVKEAAERIGVSVSTLSRYERFGLNRRMRLSRFTGIAKAYGIGIDELCSTIRSESGAMLWARREELGLSGVEMAERLGCKLGAVIDLEFDGVGRECPPDTLRGICKAYRVSADDLLARME